MSKCAPSLLCGTQKVHLVWLLARPGYIRNGIEATLRAIEGLVIQVLDVHELTTALLEEKNPDLILVSPLGLTSQTYLALFERALATKERLLLVVEPYAEKSELKPDTTCKIVEIETAAQLRQIVLETLRRLDSQDGVNG